MASKEAEALFTRDEDIKDVSDIKKMQQVNIVFISYHSINGKMMN